MSQARLKFITKPIGAAALSRVIARLLRGSVLFENRRGDTIELSTFNATEAKNRLGKVLDVALREGAAVIMRHEVPSVVVLSWDEFEALEATRRERAASSRPDFEALLGRMQTVQAKQASRDLFAVSGEQLGEAALAVKRQKES
jgi:prevent-host-death family protein